MTAIIHRTPGLIPIEAFTIAGLSAKPNSRNPIGKFGTGLKYSIAVLVRMDIRVRLLIGTTEYVFYKQLKNFRGTPYYSLRMKKRTGLLSKWSYHDMPFTTEYGKFWELWQVFRELNANTLDECGETFELPSADDLCPTPNETYFIIEDPRYSDVYHERDRIFLPEGLKVRTSSEAIQVLDRPSQHIYFRGLRIMDLKKKAMFTYNFLENVDLTEDRTAKHPSLLEALIVGYMQESNDTSFLQRAVAHPEESSFEHGLHHGTAYTSSYSSPSPSTVYLSAARDSSLSTAKEVWNGSQPTVATTTSVHLTIPKTLLSQEEIQLIQEAVKSIHPDSTINVNGQHLPTGDDTIPF